MNVRLSVIVLLVCFLFACGAAPKVGVRKTFKNHTVDRVALIGVYSTGSFSLEETEYERLHALYVEATEQSLRELGFAVVTATEFKESFLNEEARGVFWDGIPTHRSLAPMFEPERGELGTEVSTVVTFSKSLPAKSLLIAQIVYFTRGVCDSKTTDYNARVVVEPKGVPLPSECTVSHFEAKLIDSVTGSTMWHNSTLFEHRGTNDEQTERNVIFENVRRVLKSETGLQTFRPSS